MNRVQKNSSQATNYASNKSVYALLLCVICLFAIGLIMVFDTTAAEAIDRLAPELSHAAFYRQILYACIGLTCGSICYRLGYQRMLRVTPFLLIGMCFILALVLIPGVGKQINGARRWIEILGFSFQPSEFAKIFIPLFYIHILKDRMCLSQFLKILGLIALPLGLILLEPDNGTVAIILTTMMALFFLSRIRWVYWALPVMAMCITGAAIGLNMPHVRSRLQVYLDPELDLRGKGHQPYQAKIAAGSGQLWGRGPGESLQKRGYLPEARSDYIAAIFAEEFGFIGIFVLIILLMLITYFGFRIARHAHDRSGFYTAAILTFLLSFQAFLNLGVVSGLLPSKGTNLPFFSHGGSSLIASTMALSLILNVGREKKTHDKAKKSIARSRGDRRSCLSRSGDRY